MLNISEKKIHIYFLAFIISYSLFLRFVNPKIIAILFILGIFYFLANDFYKYFYEKLELFKAQFKNKEQAEYSWGYVGQENNLYNELKKISKFLISLDINEYKNYLKNRKLEIIFSLFIAGDIIFAFKNLDLYHFGVYISMSSLCKLVFIGYYYYQKKLENVEKEDKDLVFEIFSSFLNLFLTCSTIVFVLMFIASKIFNDIFFGSNYLPFNTTLPFIFLVNVALAVSYTIYKTSLMINEKDTNKILKIYSVFFVVAFVFSNSNSLDSVTYFVIGTSCVLSIFLYNLIIKQPSYIKNNYNHLF